MAVCEEESSFTFFKSYIEMSINASSVSKPPRVLTPYNQYCFERQTEERTKGKISIIQLNRILAEEWKTMKGEKKDVYRKCYDKLKAQYDELYREYKLFSKPEKATNGYLFYFKQKYPNYQKRKLQIAQNKETRRIANEWSLLDDSLKYIYRAQAEEWQKKIELKSEYLMEKKTVYELRVAYLRQRIQEEKQRVLSKYGVEKVKKKVKKSIRTEDDIERNVLVESEPNDESCKKNEDQVQPGILIEQSQLKQQNGQEKAYCLEESQNRDLKKYRLPSKNIYSSQKQRKVQYKSICQKQGRMQKHIT